MAATANNQNIDLIDISGLDKALVLVALHNHYVPSAATFFRSDESITKSKRIDIGDMSIAQAHEYLQRHPNGYIREIGGRPMEIDISGDKINPRIYDRDIEAGTAREAITALRAFVAEHKLAGKTRDFLLGFKTPDAWALQLHESVKKRDMGAFNEAVAKGAVATKMDLRIALETNGDPEMYKAIVASGVKTDVNRDLSYALSGMVGSRAFEDQEQAEAFAKYLYLHPDFDHARPVYNGAKDFDISGMGGVKWDSAQEFTDTVLNDPRHAVTSYEREGLLAAALYGNNQVVMDAIFQDGRPINMQFPNDLHYCCTNGQTPLACAKYDKLSVKTPQDYLLTKGADNSQKFAYSEDLSAPDGRAARQTLSPSLGEKPPQNS
ncbi:MAG: hypothetical protein P4M15_12655 [Alphaproteobacteria bacterium]|nr:hypothetical protein [Alphaproteobacteria bacterium]